MPSEFASILSGALTGFIVGMTGVGGGALMTPLLILVLGVAPSTAVGTDLLFATITKVVAVRQHRQAGTVDWLVVKRLASGSIPSAIVMLVLMHYLNLKEHLAGTILPALGVALVLTAIAMLMKGKLAAVGKEFRLKAKERFKKHQPILTVGAGVFLGAMVALTSIGAGALGTVMLVYLYPLRLTPAKLVGTDLAHAIPLALVAGLGHLFLGNINFQLLGWLLVGSLPAAYLGSRVSVGAPEGFIRSAIAAVLLLVGIRILA
jgi:uncharacterized membrane protein YfcA